MIEPDWFLIVKEWKRQMGNVGVTLPFLVGALNYKNRIISSQIKSAQEIVDNIINNPIEGYITEVRQCPDISAPVFSVVKYNDEKNRVLYKSVFYAESSSVESLVFSSDLHSKQGLNCSEKYECLKKLIEQAEIHISKEEYSKNRVEGNLGMYEYGGFNQRDLAFIKSVIIQNT